MLSFVKVRIIKRPNHFYEKKSQNNGTSATLTIDILFVNSFYEFIAQIFTDKCNNYEAAAERICTKTVIDNCVHELNKRVLLFSE